MKKMMISLLLSAFALSSMAQEATTANDSTEGFRFTTIDSIAISPVKDQNRSST